MTASSIPTGPFTLSGPVDKPDPRRVPLRGDLAHIALAGRYFVSHYIMPIQRMAGDCGAQVRAGPSDDTEIIHNLGPGGLFEVLDIARDWAWGCCGLGGPVGYVKLEELEDPFA